MALAWFTWDKPAFVHWIVPELAVQVPDGLELDRWQGDPVVSLVGLHAVGPAPRAWVRSRFAPASSYTQVNLRTYVRGPAGPGILLIDTRVDRRLPVAARLLGNPYHFDGETAVAIEAGHVTLHARGIEVEGIVSGDEPGEQPRGSFDAFVLERYQTFARLPGGLVYVTSIRHRPWRVRGVGVEQASMSGWERLGRPVAAHAAEPVEVAVTGVAPLIRSRRRSRWRTSPARA